MKWDWSKTLILVMGLFIAMIVAMGIRMATSNQSLYETDYYEKGEQHTERMQKEAEAKNVKMEVDFLDEKITMQYDSLGGLTSIKMLHLSNAEKDVVMKLEQQEKPSQTVSIGTLSPGIWMVEAEGKVNGKAFYIKKQVVR